MKILARYKKVPVPFSSMETDSFVLRGVCEWADGLHLSRAPAHGLRGCRRRTTRVTGPFLVLPRVWERERAPGGECLGL